MRRNKPIARSRPTLRPARAPSPPTISPALDRTEPVVVRCDPPVVATAPAKVGDLISTTLRKFVASGAVQCRWCLNPAIELHHAPPRGVLGFTFDLLSVPVCREDHDRCHANAIRADMQAEQVAKWWRYLTSKHPAVARAALAEMAID